MNFKQEIALYRTNHPVIQMKINGGLFKYTLTGSGDKTLVFLTGGLGISEAFFKHCLAFEKNAKVLMFDYPLEFVTNNTLADGVAALIETLGLKQVILVGQSYGGLLGQVIAKRHPSLISGMILSNTGTYTSQMDAAGKKELKEMAEGMDQTIKMVKKIPFFILRPLFLKKIIKKVDGATLEEKQYIHDLFKEVLGQLSKEKEIHMCTLMKDLIESQCFEKEDFAYLEGKVYLLLSEDDETFGESVKAGLVDVMTQPVVYKHMAGGHLALFLRIDEYVEKVVGFIS